jgi:hypothetical protein
METIILIVQLLTLLVFGYLLKSYLPSYFQEKGKNLATKEDVEEITRKMEGVKAEVLRGTRAEETKFRLKYEACLDALALVDAHFSHSLNNPGGPQPSKQYSTTEKARACHSKLILSCENVEILNLFGEIMFGPRQGEELRKPPTDLLNDFRNLVRRELGFGQDLPLDRERAWFGKVVFEKEDKA